jgi:hypothetical protein
MVRFASTCSAAILALASFASSAALPGGHSGCHKGAGAHHGNSSIPVAYPAPDAAPAAAASSAPVAHSAPVASSASVVSSSSADTSASGEVYKGDTTWYGKTCGEEECWQGGACAFVDYTLPATIDGSTCVSEVIWNSSYHCGACVEITYQGKKKIAMVRKTLKPHIGYNTYTMIDYQQDWR